MFSLYKTWLSKAEKWFKSPGVGTSTFPPMQNCCIVVSDYENRNHTSLRRKPSKGWTQGSWTITFRVPSIQQYRQLNEGNFTKLMLGISTKKENKRSHLCDEPCCINFLHWNHESTGRNNRRYTGCTKNLRFGNATTRYKAGQGRLKCKGKAVGCKCDCHTLNNPARECFWFEEESWVYSDEHDAKEENDLIIQVTLGINSVWHVCYTQKKFSVYEFFEAFAPDLRWCHSSPVT